MQNITRLTLAAVLTTTFACAGVSTAANDEQSTAFAQAVRAALDADWRTADERTRDKNRKPLETLTFFEISNDMDVLELVPGGGWYTKILAPSVKHLSVWIGIGRFADRIDAPGFAEVKRVAPEATLETTERRGIFALAAVDFGKSEYDAVLTFRNLHNLTAEARAVTHEAVFRALRPGGVYGVVDHTRRHMEPDDTENRRRLDPVVAVQEIVAAGFIFEASSDLHYRPDDELRYEVGRKTVAGNTDRFTMRFRKPR